MSFKAQLSPRPRSERKRKVNYERHECVEFYNYVCEHYADIKDDLQRHECGGTRRKVERAMLQLEGEKPGFPDYFLYYPSGQFPGLAIEMKKSHKGGGAKPKATPQQIARIQRFRERGYAAYICEGAEEAIRVLKKYLSFDK